MKLGENELIIFTKFHEYWAKNVDLLLMANFWTWALYFDLDFISGVAEHMKYVHVIVCSLYVACRACCKN